MTVAARLRKLEAPVNALTDGQPWSTEADPNGEWVDGYVVKLGCNEWFEPSHDLPHFKDYAAFVVTVRNLLPLLADLAEAAEQVAVLEYDPQRSAEENTELLRRASAFRAVLARLSERLEEST